MVSKEDSSSAAMSSGVGVLAFPLTIDGVDPGDPLQLIPAGASTTGAILRIPPWAPSTIAGSSDLLEIWALEPGATAEVLFYSNLFSVPVEFPSSIDLSAQYLQRAGQIQLRYRVTLGDNQNDDSSAPQRFTVSPPVVVNLLAPQFIVESSHNDDFEIWGYLNCRVVPRLWDRVLLQVPAQPGRFEVNDELILDWQGFRNLNGTDPIAGTAGRFSKFLTQAEASSLTGFIFVVGSDKYIQYIEPITFGSAQAFYTVYRGGVPLGRSRADTVRIDRKISGEGLCDASFDPYP
ncbi:MULTISPECIES: hypothetical protein [unclassified Pseudomonas]|uniref:hypothetical protein n=1 Tax=unclassified Pseudomonas TaxID=196821 RepID=UPI002AC99B30|nr:MULTISPECIES: hypothetical protein [unclassified Pseudomonas]MEB0045273.1 hypothetical protein [Pseudomonas sp. Dout3]MEB0096371.1 hypothetical protein [Pseudomonas sp. DC1.2]WPX61329.1 hypothetical protein RHM68_12045 [Pseudomonas sp. DC1.2]